MATISMPKKEAAGREEVPVKAGQARQPLERYWLQVDRQTKQSFKTAAEAEKVGKAIKKAHPIVQVAIYDAEESQNTVLSA